MPIPVLAGLEMAGDAPAAAENAVVALDELSERVPVDASSGRIVYVVARPSQVCVALRAQDSSAARDKRSASSAGALIMGQ
jgi:hypothetical protein